MKLIISCIALLWATIGIAQQPHPNHNDAFQHYNFTQEQIIQNNDTITYYLRNYKTKPKNLVVFIQGTDANPLFSYKIKDDKILYYRWFNDEYKSLDSSYTYAIVPKPGMAGLYKEDEISIPKNYYQNNHLEYRVNQLDATINHIVQNHLSNPETISVYGHSEGAAIGAALANTNKHITHLGFWSGNVLNNFYEFALFNRIEALKDNISDTQAHENIMGILEWYKAVIKDPEATDLDHFGFTNKRWSSYEKAPIDDLLQLQIPIYALFGTEDESTPIETAYLLPVKFMENRKDNLTFEVCIGCDHSYQEQTEEGAKQNWNKEFLKFIAWTAKTKAKTKTKA